MKGHLFRPIVAASGLLACLWTVQLGSQPREMSVEWIYSDEGKAVSDVPDYVWLQDDTALIYDTRVPASRRTFERLEPAAGARRPALDMARALASLSNVATDSGVSGALPWPLSFDARGEQALQMDESGHPVLKREGCVSCASCIRACISVPPSFVFRAREE